LGKSIGFKSLDYFKGISILLRQIRSVIKLINGTLEKGKLDENSKKALTEAREKLYCVLDELIKIKGLSREVVDLSGRVFSTLFGEKLETTTRFKPDNLLEILNESVYVEAIIDPRDPEKVSIAKIIPRTQPKVARKAEMLA